MEQRVNGKCSHGIYWPSKDPIAFGCQQCNPDGMGDGAIPVLPRSSGDPLESHVVSHADDYCTQCGNVRTYSSPDCRVCGKMFPVVELRGQTSASNNRQSGQCPKCNSAVHFETDKPSVWECSDCGEHYKAPKRKGDEQSTEL